ncbi:MAG: TOBE domain-containing protein, partial [Pseudomonadota bacterium]|nr:TOBE domain-containing protein [Pseudomonadota bacterium]
DGQPVVYGVRPGDLGVGGGADVRSVPAEVIVVEPTGAETELLVRVGGSQFVVVIHGRTQAEPGETIHLSVATAAVHLFDPTSGTALTA